MKTVAMHIRIWGTVPAAIIALSTISACDLIPLNTEQAPVNFTDIFTFQDQEYVERSDIFSAFDLGLWDGRPSFGTVWIAHPDIRVPQEVVIRNVSNGKFVVGMVYQRTRVSPGPIFQLSSDTARALEIGAGQPVKLSVVAVLTEVQKPENPAFRND